MRNLLSVLVPLSLCAASLLAQDPPEGLSASDWSSIRAAYEAGRHKVFAQDGGHQARSPHQQWTVRFDGRGVAVQPDAGDWQWGLELVSFGFVGSEREVATPQSVHADGQRLTYAWDATLDEWYVNATGGLEHGYTVRQRPEGDGTLTFLLDVRGGPTPVIQNNGRDVVFQRDGETLLDYTGLHVFDADGKTLPARFSVQREGLLLSIDERGARYPVTIDPVAQHAYLKASNTGAGDNFGLSVAVSGDTVVVGAEAEDSSATGIDGNQADNSASAAGAAYVFVRSVAGWQLQAYLKASNTGAGDSFGYSVAVSGDTVVVGARGEDSNAIGINGSQGSNSAPQAGAAYVFVRSGSSWSQQAYLKASNTGAGDFFGTSVAVSADTVVVGARGEDSSATGIDGNQTNNSAMSSGAAYVFARRGTSWSHRAYLKASNTDAGDVFGWSVAVSGDTVVVSAQGERSNATGIDGNQADNSALDAGAAYVFSIARLRPSLWPLNACKIGQPWTVALENMNPSPGAAVFLVGFTQFPLPGIDLGPLVGMEGCDIYQTLDGSDAMVVSGSTATWTWSTVAGLPGDRFWCQAACLDPGVNTLGVSISNQVEVTLVP